MAEKVIQARFAHETDVFVTVEFVTASPVTAKCASLYLSKRIVSTAVVVPNKDDECKGSARFTVKDLDYSTRYYFALENGETVAVNNAPLIDGVRFIKLRENSDTQSVELGVIYEKTRTVFRVWAPFASAVKLKLYVDALTEKSKSVAMTKRKNKNGEFGGVWEIEQNGDLDGAYYNFVVTNFGAVKESVDPYAKACSANGVRGMVVNLEKTNPEGWKDDKRLCVSTPAASDVPIIWETSVKDFSASADSGMKYKGKFLAFTERGTVVPGTDMKTGVDYLKGLGVTYVHLNPIYDFATVDEAEPNNADNSADAYNWGYDPQNYNVPEGSYATDSFDGRVRITELKSAVKALHDAGIGVIIDVVYNHTYTTGGQAFHYTAPLYYHRTDERCAFTNDSGCGNGTASERTMMRRFMVESVLYWAKEYHVDGFRFDLMGIHDAVTLNMIRAKLDKLDGGAGRKILMYGEPWSADGTYTPHSYTARIGATARNISGTGKYTLNSGNKLIKHMFSDSFGDEHAFDMLSDRIAVFNGSGRDGLRGACNDKTPCAGWVNGVPQDLGKVKKLIEGGAGGFGEGLNLGAGSRNVAYAAAHDNYTLWDHLAGAKHGDASTLYYDYPYSEAIKRNMLVSAAYLMSTGMCFMLAGEEFARTKYGNEDSYNSPVKLNAISWARRKEFAPLFEHYKKLIALRKKYAAKLFSYEKSTDKAYAYGNFTEADFETGRFVFRREKSGTELILELDPTALCGKITIGDTVYEF